MFILLNYFCVKMLKIIFYKKSLLNFIFILFTFNLNSIHTQHIKNEAAPKISLLKPKNVTILSKTDVIFECQVFGYPAAQITWRKNQRQISENSKKYKIIQGPNINFLRVSDLNSITPSTVHITCVAENNLGKAEQTATLHIIPEKEKPKYYPHIVISNPKSVEPDNPFRIECNISHLTSSSSVQWFQMNKPIQADNKKYFINATRSSDGTTRHILSVKGLSLSIESGTESQEIEFACSATNSHGTNMAETSILLRNRLMPPNFVLPKRTVIELEYGSSYNLTCQANGMPKPKVRWQEAKPEAPIDLNVSMIYSNSIELEWKPGGQSEVNYYIIKYREDIKKSEYDYYLSDYDFGSHVKDPAIVSTTTSADYTRYESDENELFYYENTTSTKFKTQSKLKPFTYYIFQVVAVNSLGESKSSKSIRVQTAASKPGLVKNIRYTYQDDSTFIIKCDEPDDPNGILISYKIYYTNQPLNRIENWHSVTVPINDMPYPLTVHDLVDHIEIYKQKTKSNQDEQSFYMRISAINSEIGEGPRSNIIQLRKSFKKLDPPQNFHYKDLQSDRILLKWSYNLQTLQQFQQTNTNNNNNNNIIDTNLLEKNLNFELYLNKTQYSSSNELDQQHHQQQQQLLSTHQPSKQQYTSFRTISSIKTFKNNKGYYEYNLTNLQSNTQYIFYLSARFETLESLLAGPLVIQTPTKSSSEYKLTAIRVDNLREFKTDSTSITIEWTNNYLNDTLSSSSEQSTIGSGGGASSLNDNSKWIGYKIKYQLMITSPSQQQQQTNNDDKLSSSTNIFIDYLNNLSQNQYKIQHLKPFTLYKIQVSAYKSNNDEGPASNSILVKTLEAVPGMPQNVRLVNVQQNSIEIEWQSPRQDEQNGLIRGYQIHIVKQDSSNRFIEPRTDKVRDTVKLKYKIDNLDSGSTYKIQVAAFNSKGDGTRSAPLIVNTLFDSLAKPKNIKHNILANELTVEWQKPQTPQQSSANSNNNKLFGYSINFNNQKYDSNTNTITFKQPKWDYNQNYVISISAKYLNTNGSVLFSDEAQYKISTYPPKIKLIVDKITTTSALIKWNTSLFEQQTSKQTTSRSYKLDYYQENEPNKIKSLDVTRQIDVELSNLKPNSVYIIQFTAYSNDDAKEQALTNFKTLINDIPSPTNLQVARIDTDKVNVKWDQIEGYNSEQIRGYRVYFSEYNAEKEFNWTPTDVQLNDNLNTNIDITSLNPQKEYAFKVVAVDPLNNEGKESNIEIAYKYDSNKVKNVSPPSTSSNIVYQINEQIGMPQQVDILDVSQTTAKFSWKPPTTSTLPYKSSQLSFRLSYKDRLKYYKDSDGKRKSFTSSILMHIPVPSRLDDPTTPVTWLVTGLLPDTTYDFNISAVVNQTLQGPPVMRVVKTKRDRPEFVDRPLIKEVYDDNMVHIDLGNATEKYGPISRYWLIVVPNTDINRGEETHERDLLTLEKYSLMNSSLSNESAFIAAEFEASAWPTKFLLGDGRSYGRFMNRPLTRGVDYRVYTTAFTDETTNSQSSAQSSGKSSSNQMLNVVFPVDDIGNLYTTSQYSEVFNTKPIEYKPLHANDYQNILWIAGIIGALTFILILIAIASIRLMQKKRKTLNTNNTNNGTTINNHHHHHIATTTTTTTSSSASPTALLLNSNGIHQTIQPGASNTLSHKQQTVTMMANNDSNANSLGLLTTVQPMNHHHLQQHHHQTSTMSSPTHISENLYTSIDATQRQHLLSQYNQALPPPPPAPPQYESNTLSLQSTFLSSTLTHGGHTVNNHHHANASYDPVELRRIQHQTIGMQSHPPIKIEDLSAYIDNLKTNQNEKFSIEYESIEPGQQFQWENSTLEYNRSKNRYANVIAYDHSRVSLQTIFDQPGTDYINANYMDGYRKRNAYVATQGPLPSTYGEFWRMIWEQHTSTIVMMTKLEERNRLKCDQYWPNKGTEIYGNCMQVSLVDFTELSTHSVRTFVISRVNSGTNEGKREVKHFQYTAWPDHGVPDHPTPFLMFVRRVRNTNPNDSGPIVVHCSAGVGRTGCYIVIDSMMERLKYEKTVDIYGHVTCLRAQRNYMVQTEDQYIFCYDAVLEAAQSGCTEIPAGNLYTHLERLLQTIDDSTLTEMEFEYKRLSNIKASNTKFLSANMNANKFKNRLVNILPYEATRVCLSPLPASSSSSSTQTPQHGLNTTTNNGFIEGSDYINANFIDGYRYRKAYIATQAPLNETIEDFWRMLWEHNSTIIVMLTKLREMGREKCAQYWPSERSVRYQYFVVDPIAEYNMSQYILREFKVTDARDGQSRTIRQFQYVDWPEQGVPKSGESIIELIGQVHKTKEQFGQTGPITVHCSAGVGRTGVFITLSIVLERMRFEGMIDVFNTVKMLRTQRPAMVQTEDQYQFCYRAALEYLGSFDNYDP